MYKSRFFRESLVVLACVCGFACSGGTTTPTPTSSPVTLSATSRGWYDLNGVSNGSGAGNNYVVGDCNIIDPSCRNGTGPGELRNWFRFDLSAVTMNVTAATLVLDVPTGGGLATACRPVPCTGPTTATYTLFDISPDNLGSLGTTSVAIWTDLASGVSYGSQVASTTSSETTLAVSLNAVAIAAINSKKGTSFALGGALTTLNGGAELQLLFNTSASTNRTLLQLTP